MAYTCIVFISIDRITIYGQCFFLFLISHSLIIRNKYILLSSLFYHIYSLIVIPYLTTKTHIWWYICLTVFCLMITINIGTQWNSLLFNHIIVIHVAIRIVTDSWCTSYIVVTCLCCRCTVWHIILRLIVIIYIWCILIIYVCLSAIRCFTAACHHCWQTAYNQCNHAHIYQYLFYWFLHKNHRPFPRLFLYLTGLCQIYADTPGILTFGLNIISLCIYYRYAAGKVTCIIKKNNGATSYSTIII